MLTDERLKQLMEQVGMPNSVSLMQALRQCDMEATLAERARCAAICDDLPAKDPKGAWFNDDMSAGARECAAAIRAS